MRPTRPPGRTAGATTTAARWAWRAAAAVALAAAFSMYGQADLIVALAGTAWTCF